MATNKRRIEKTSFVCYQCGPYGRVYCEVSSEISDGPIKIELVQYDDYGAVMVEEINVSTKKGKEFYRTYFCGGCGCPVSKNFNTSLLCC